MTTITTASAPPDLLRYGSFQRCAALLDYIEDEYHAKAGETLVECLERLSALGEYFWREVAEWWSMMDAIEHENMEMFFEQFAEEWSLKCMSDANQRAWKRLPHKKRITIYRGQDLSLPVGLAWTTNRKKAEWFANAGMRGYRRNSPVILTAKLWKSEVALCLNERGESEIIPFAIPTDYTVEHQATSAKKAA